MGLFDRVKGGSRSAQRLAVVIVKRFPGQERGKASLRTRLRARLRPLPEGSGPEGDVTQLVPSHQAHLITAGMEVPALLDPDTSQPLCVQKDGLDEAIGRHYLGLEPEHGTWEAAFGASGRSCAKRRERWRESGSESPGTSLLARSMTRPCRTPKRAVSAAKQQPGGATASHAVPAARGLRMETRSRASRSLGASPRAGTQEYSLGTPEYSHQAEPCCS